jgi:hypothetical protein
MIAVQLVAVGLVVTVATGPIVEPRMSRDMSAQQKSTALQPLVNSATECIARAVAPSGALAVADNLGDLIVASMPSCIGPVRAMIHRYDDFFGDGTGEAFFMGPYLDVLPAAIMRWVRQHVR